MLLVFVELLIEVGKIIMDEPQEDSYIISYIKQFTDIYLKKICEIVVLDPIKTSQMCRIVAAHCSDNINGKILMLKAMKGYLADNLQALTYTFAKMLEIEPEYNETLFDIYMYYAMNGLSYHSPIVRTASLRMLSIMADHNYEYAFNLVDKFAPLIVDEYWEVKAQLYVLSCQLLRAIEAKQSPSKAEDLPSTATNNKAQAEKNIFQSKVDKLYKIIGESVTEHSSLLVIKIAIYHLIPLLNSYKQFYPQLISLIFVLPLEMLNAILDPPGEDIGEEGLPYTYSSYLWMYPCKCKAKDIDKLVLMRNLAEIVLYM